MNRVEYSFIIVALSRVDANYYSTSLSIANELGKRHKVFFVNNPYTHKELVQKITKSSRMKRLSLRLLFGKIIYENVKASNFVSVVSPFVLPINWLPRSGVFDFFRRINQNVLKKVIKDIVKRYQINKYIYINSYNPYYLGFLPDDFGRELSIYQSVDDISQNSYTAKHGEELEKKVVSNVDMVFVTSSALKKRLMPLNEKTYVITNAADFDLFNSVLTKRMVRPVELEGLNGTIIGYTGNLDDSRIDFELLREIALQFSNSTLLLIGPVNSSAFFELGLDNIRNIVALGPKKIEELPSYLKFMDVTLIPFKTNKLTSSIYPLKINEYLAAGKPVVSTRFSKDIESFKDVIEIGDSVQDFLLKIEKSIKNANNEMGISERVAEAKTNTWENRIEQIWKCIEENQKSTSV